jgi:hypothetical protein
MFRRLIAAAIFGAFLFNIAVSPSEAAYFQAPPAVPSLLLRELTPPEDLGVVSDAHLEAATAPLVIHIQDLHANYEVQTKIARLLAFYQKRFKDKTIHVHPFRVAVEGAEGPVKTEEFAKLPDPAFKAEMCDKLLKAAELTGAEAYAITSGQPGMLWGVENERYHLANIDVFRSTFKQKEELAAGFGQLEKDLEPIRRKFFDRAMRKVDKKAADYAAGKLDLADYTLFQAREAIKLGINVPLQYPEIAKLTGYAPAETYANTDKLFTEQSDLLKEVQSRLAKTGLQRNAAEMTYEIGLLKRLVTEQITTEEVRTLAPRLKNFAGRAKQLLEDSGVAYDRTNLADLLSASLDFYAIALLRDKYLAENTLSFMNSSPDRAPRLGADPFVGLPGGNPQKLGAAVLVAGGFHTPGITKILKSRGISYIVITPTLTSDKTNRDLYNERLLGHHVTPEQFVARHTVSVALNAVERVATVSSLIVTWMNTKLGGDATIEALTLSHLDPSIRLPAITQARELAALKPPSVRAPEYFSWLHDAPGVAGGADKPWDANILQTIDSLRKQGLNEELVPYVRAVLEFGPLAGLPWHMDLDPKNHGQIISFTALPASDWANTQRRVVRILRNAQFVEISSARSTSRSNYQILKKPSQVSDWFLKLDGDGRGEGYLPTFKRYRTEWQARSKDNVSPVLLLRLFPDVETKQRHEDYRQVYWLAVPSPITQEAIQTAFNQQFTDISNTARLNFHWIWALPSREITESLSSKSRTKKSYQYR